MQEKNPEKWRRSLCACVCYWRIVVLFDFQYWHISLRYVSLKRLFTLFFKLFTVIRTTLKVWGCVENWKWFYSREIFDLMQIKWVTELKRENWGVIFEDFSSVNIRHRDSCLVAFKRTNISLKLKSRILKFVFSLIYIKDWIFYIHSF